jgi:hypothetical protein
MQMGENLAKSSAPKRQRGLLVCDQKDEADALDDIVVKPIA